MWKVLGLTFCIAGPGSLGAQSEHLGTITFPTSGSPAAQEHFLRGTLYLHSFEYELAAKEYQEAQRMQPDFAMAYWGEAMTYNHPVWNQQDKPAALGALNRLGRTPAARAAKAPTRSEKAWLHAVEVLYGDGSKEKRDTLYSREMERIAAAAPEDDEAQTFYALSLLGLSQSIRVVPTYMRAGAIALAVMKRNPDHPGATHYVIHAFDDPEHARQGLGAARAYSGIAPGAAHAQHMTTHIFLALGMWDDVVKQNVIALGPDSAKWRPGHYSSWLLYGLLQQGKEREASKLLALMDSNTAVDAPLSQRANLVLMRDYYVINAEQWTYSPPLPELSGVGPNFKAVRAFTTGYAALKRQQVDLAGRQLDTLIAMTHVAESPPVVGILAYELAGLVHLARADTAGGLRNLHQAAAIEDTLPVEFGPPLILKPTHEALGETYLALNRPAEAEREFQRALELAPRRRLSWLGYFQSEVALRAQDSTYVRVVSESNCTFTDSFKCAIDALERWYAIDSTKADSIFFLRITGFAGQLAESPDTSRLLKWAQIGVRKYPTNITLLNELFGAYAITGQMDSAMAIAMRMVELDTTTAGPYRGFVINEMANRDSIGVALPLIDMVARRGSREEKENTSILLVNAAFRVLQRPPKDGIADTVRLSEAAGLSRRALQLADSTGRAWPNANYALALSLVFMISKIDPAMESGKSCPLALREQALVSEAIVANGRGRAVNVFQSDQYQAYLERISAKLPGMVTSYCN